jgi:hypothetical protein
MTPEDNKRLYYIRGILRNRFEERGAAYWDDEKALRYLRNAVERGASVSDLEVRAKRAVNWSSFFNPIRDALADDLYDNSDFSNS